MVLRQKANAHAALGEARECAAAFDAAFEVVSEQDPDGAALAGYCTVPFVAMEAGMCWLRLGTPTKAIETFAWAQAGWPGALRRDQGLALARIATAHARADDLDGACDVGRAAVAIARSVHSARTLHQLHVLHGALRPARGRAEAAELMAAIVSLVTAAA